MRSIPAPRFSAVTAAGASLVLILSGCSGSDDAAAPVSEETEAAVAEAEETTEAEPEAAPAAAGEETEVSIGETIEDPDMGDSIEVVSALRDFPSEEEADLIAEGGEVVLLEVSVTPGTEYGGLISMGNFKISWDDGADFWGNKTRMVEEEMDAAGYTPFEDVSRRDGGEHTGWIAFLADERAETYLVEYSRAGAEVIGSDETIDEFTTEFEIPAP